MKLRVLLTMVAILAIGAGTALANVEGTGHDLADDGLGTDQTCIFCHAPHNPNPGSTPLWNHSESAETFSMYPSAELDGTIDSTPNSASLRCLSCHDGVTNLDAYGGMAGTSSLGDLFPVSTANVGTNLQDDHPVSVDMTGMPAGAQTNAEGAGLKFFNNKTECGSCHEPHDTTNAPFLRMSNAGSALCEACHTDK